MSPQTSSPHASAQESRPSLSLVQRITGYVLPYKRQFFLALFLGILLSIIAPLRPYLIQFSIDHYIEKSLLHGLILLSLLQIGLVVLETFFRFSFSYLSAWMGQRIIEKMRLDLFRKIVSLNVRQFDKTPVGIFSTRTIDDCERINDIFSDGLLPVMVDITSVIAILGYMFYLDVHLALISLSPFPILLVGSYLFKNSVNKSFNKVRTAVASLNAFANEHLSGIKTIQSFCAESISLKEFNAHNTLHKQENIKSITAYSLFFPLVEIVSALSIGILVWWGAGENAPPGKIIAFIVCIHTIFRPLRVIADKFNTIQMGFLSAKRIFKIFENEDVSPSGTLIPSKNLVGKIVFKNVSFGYDDMQWVLKDVSFEINPGESVAILGRTGSGKSTIVSLIGRIYQHQKGTILIDGQRIEDFDGHYLRSQIGFVSQDIFLFGGSLYENISVGNSDLSLEQVKMICRDLGIEKMIAKLPRQYFFQVAEGGSNLSTGQRQLISIARVFAKNPSIIIFDEATSSIDAQIEEVVDFASQKILKGKTSIIIAHRQKTVLKANKILVLNSTGELIEQGNAKMLEKKEGGYYATFIKGKKDEA